MKTPFLDTARRVIRTEADALNTLADVLDVRFRDAIDIIMATKGRVIVTGIGKSGHIANKIAATFASTGTPAQFVHPAEASHGDLGMIENSSLGSQCDVLLLLPQLGEACSTGVVPTTSTTLTLAMGDALAVALMENREFTAEHFRDFHPGGKLGARLARVADLMHTGAGIPITTVDATMADVLREIGGKGFGVVCVTDNDGHMQGIITNGDLSRHMDGLASKTASDVMTPSPITIDPNALAEKAVGIMNNRKITCLLVVDPNQPTIPVGLLHIHDCLRVGLG